MLVAECPRSASPPFPGTVCATPGCGTVLSAYNDDPDRLCAVCRRKANDVESRSAIGVDLERLVAGILLTRDALHPGESVNVGLELSVLGIAADSRQVGLCVRHLVRRHGLVARGQRGRPGYIVEEWERRYQPVRGFGGVVMERDPESGQWRPLLPDLLPQSEEQGDVDGHQLSLLGSEGATPGRMDEPET